MGGDGDIQGELESDARKGLIEEDGLFWKEGGVNILYESAVKGLEGGVRFDGLVERFVEVGFIV